MERDNMSTPLTRDEIAEVLVNTWRANGGLSAVESGMVNMPALMADAVLELQAGTWKPKPDHWSMDPIPEHWKPYWGKALSTNDPA